MNIKKYLSFIFVFTFIVTISSFVVSKTEAATFPFGCSSAIGYSVMTGQPCNGTQTATNMIPGCANPLGYSLTSGIPCSGTSEALTYLGGCTSIYGYSIFTGDPCNGTAVAVSEPGTIPTPGLPTTGSGGLSLINTLLLLCSGTLIIGSTIYATRKVRI